MPWKPFGDDNPDNVPNDPVPEPPKEHDCDDDGGSFIKPFSEWFKPDPEEPKEEVPGPEWNPFDRDSSMNPNC